MKFQNSSIHGFKVMLCIKKRDERTDGRTDGRTTQKQYAPRSWGHNKVSELWPLGFLYSFWYATHPY